MFVMKGNSDNSGTDVKSHNTTRESREPNDS